MDSRTATSMKRIAFKTFGCRANTNDTDALYLEAKKRGYQLVEETEPADAYVINTCTVTENADRDARHQAFRFKRQNQGALVAMVGCYAQVGKEEILKLPEVDVVVGTANKFKVLDHFDSLWNGKLSDRDQVEQTAGFLPEHFPGSNNARANVKIQDGCNYRCSFCIIPQARGRSRSLPLGVVLRQVEEAYSQGFNEIVLTGIHLAHYGWDQGTDLSNLLKELLRPELGPRIRLSTLDPFEIPDGLIEMLKMEKRFCPHLHIALQSGSDSVLARMRRIYQAREFSEVTAKIQQTNPDTFLGVDVIVGFPGETEAEFQETVFCLENSFWAKLHVFSYSPREGTEAAGLKDPLPPSVIAQRSGRLRSLSEKRHIEFLNSQIGKRKDVILERPHRTNPSLWLGHTENYLPVYLSGISGPEKSLVSTLMQKREGERLIARPFQS